MIFVYLGCVFLLLYYLFRKNYSYWETKNVPFDKPFLFFGSFYKVAARKENIFETIRTIYDKFDTPYVGIHIFTDPNLVIRSPELLKKVLVKDFDKFQNRKFAANESVDPIAYHALFTSKDAVWRNMRAKMSPVFTSGKMKMMLPHIKECSKDLNAYLGRHSGQTVETRNVTKKYSVDVISSCAFGINANCLKDENSEIMKMAVKLIDFDSFIRSVSVLCSFFLPKFVDIFRLTFADKRASDYLLNIFKATYKERQEKKIVRNDLIDLLHNLKNNETINEAYRFDDLKMASQAITFFSAGNDTISITVSFTLYELALNKAVQDQLRQEIRESFDRIGDFTYESVQDMKYLDMVLCEALRKYPLTTFLNRITTADYTFEETGLKLDKGTSVLVPVAGLHYDPKYFPDPDQFNPERFSDKTTIKPYTYMPFGEGPRNCIGQRFGILVCKMALVYMIKDFSFEPTDATTIPLQFSPKSIFLQNKSGVHLKVLKL